MNRMLSLLVMWALFSGFATAQVGVNNPAPQQALDVNGKIALGDDELNPTEGTLRYNMTAKTFEGYDGVQWTTLTNIANASSGSLPEGAIPVYGQTNGIPADDTTLNFSIYYRTDSTPFSAIPSNTYLLVTWINVRDNDINPQDARIMARIGPRISPSAFITSRRGLYMSGLFPNMIWTESSLSPLVICRAGEYLGASNSRFSEDAINVEMRGFLVPDLDY